MAEQDGHIQLDRTVGSIIVGHRQRTDLGDLADLVESIRQRGLLQPITITPDGVLVCGWRRLEAVKRLGWRTLRVWVRSGISTDLSRLLAEQDENELRKPLTPVEEAALYDELSRLLAEDARRRQSATRFQTGGGSSDSDGGVESTPPQQRGKTRKVAARLVTGKDSHQKLERINAIRAAATNDKLPERVRTLAATELARVEAGGAVAPAFHRLQAAIGHEPEPSPPPVTTHPEPVTRLRTPRAFVLTWSDLDGWTDHYDPTALATDLSDDDWAMFERVLSETEDFAEQVRTIRVTEAVG